MFFEDEARLQANSDGDVMLHALTNAISGITCVNILGKIADELCQQGITDSHVYLEKALESLGDWTISHVSFSIECKTPKINPKIPTIRAHIAELLSLTPEDIGMTATSGEGLTEFGRSEGIQVFCLVTATSR